MARNAATSRSVWFFYCSFFCVVSTPYLRQLCSTSSAGAFKHHDCYLVNSTVSPPTTSATIRLWFRLRRHRQQFRASLQTHLIKVLQQHLHDRCIPLINIIISINNRIILARTYYVRARILSFRSRFPSHPLRRGVLGIYIYIYMYLRKSVIVFFLIYYFFFYHIYIYLRLPDTTRLIIIIIIHRLIIVSEF